MAYTSSAVAAAILRECRERGLADVSNLKLQKLLYYTEAWHLAFGGNQLFDDAIEAWVHGPVVPRVFREYRKYRWSAVEELAVAPVDDEDVRAHIRMVLDAYGNLGATDLERLTHSELPWREARRGLEPDEPSSRPVSRTTMAAFYGSLVGTE
jgi:uncharacterized phage-associated protein